MSPLYCGRGRLAVALRMSAIGVVALVFGGAPLSVARAASNAVEGASLSSMTMPAPAGCTTPAPMIDWGDNQPQTQGECASFNTVGSGAHTYAEEGDYAVVAHYNSSNGPRDTAAVSVHVADAALIGSAAPINATAGAPLALVVAHFSDTDPSGARADYAATISWGDGTTSPGTVGGAGTFAVSGDHTYATAGTFTVTVGIADAGGASTTVTDHAVVAAVAGAIPPPKASFTIAPPSGAGAPLTFNASATHAPGTVRVQTYTWHISGANSATETCGGGTSRLSLFLPRSGAELVTLTVTDVSGHTSQIQQTAQASGLQYRPKFHIPRGLLNTVTPIAWCIPGLNDPPVDVSSNGGPPPGCNQTLDMFIVQAVGCFQEITSGRDIPAAEAAILDQQPQWAASGAHAIDGGTASLDGARTTSFKPALVGQLSGPALAYFARPFISHSEVRLNGIDYIPHNGASILVVPMLNLVISSDATVTLKDIPLGNGQIAEDVGDTHGQGYQVSRDNYRVHVDDYQLSAFAKKIGVAGLPFDGRASVDFAFHRALVSAELTMPNFFSTAGGEPFNAKVVLHTDNSSGLQLDEIHLGPVNADVFGLGFSDVKFDYDAPSGAWDAQGKLDLFGTVGIDATPNPPNPPEYGVHFRNGEFKSAGAAADFGDAGIEIFPGVQLNRIGVAVSLNPTLFIGTVGMRVLELAQIDGRVLVALPSNAAPYELTTGDAGPQFAQIAGHTFTGSPTIGVGGSLALDVADVSVPLANAYVLYSYPSYVAFGGHFQYGVDDFGVDGGVNGEFNVAADQFNVEGHVQINLPDPLPGFGGAAIVSSKGIAACGSGYVFPYGHIELGAGYRWGGGLVVWLQTCNIGEFRQQVQTSAVHGAGAPRSFTLPAGLPSAEVRIDGHGGAPTVTVRGPDGQRAGTPAASLSIQGRFLLVRTPKLNSTWIAIRHPLAGTYTVVDAPGSPAIASLATANGLGPASVTAQVSGSGAHRLLRYRVRPRPGQQVTFLDGSHVIARINHADTGTVRFAPAAGALGTRTIVAQVTLAGLPNANLTVAHFTVRRLAALKRVGHLQVDRRGGILRIRWQTVFGAASYAIYVHGTDGNVHALIVSPRRHNAVVGGIPSSTAGSVSVTALRGRDHGPRATARFRALAPLRTGVHPLQHRRHR